MVNMLIRPLKTAYAHRDCEAEHPLWDALSHGFAHIEADAYCGFGQVFVAHDLIQIRPGRTLANLYLDPLRNLKRPLFDNNQSLWLFVDIKTAAHSSYRILKHALMPYRDILTCFHEASVECKPLTIIVSGNRVSYDMLKSEPMRYLALDGRSEDIGVHTDCSVMPIISDNWRKHFSWTGAGTMPKAEREKLERWLDTCHSHQQKLRFWNTPDAPSPARTNLWTTLLDLGIDLINTDDMAGLATFLRGRHGDDN
jgi:hypothetical protein